MYRLWQRMCGTVLALIMLVNLLPMSTFAQDFQQYLAENEEVTSVTASTETETNTLEASPATIVAEIEEKRTEYSKEFLLSNGLHMAAVYADPVHYETSTGWAEIDNTLKANTDGSYRNTAGIWDVTFPQQLGGTNAVTITKDGYTLSFAMAGELRSSGQLTAQSQDLTAANLSSAQVQTIDTLAMKEEAEHPETVPDKLQSRILYADIYSNTHVQYDLDSNKVKESIVLESYSATLQGYSYTLNVGQMVPVLQDDGSILFYDKDRKDIVMVMPAPYLVDSAKEYNNDIEVQLVGKGSTYILAYILPQEWLAAEDRSWPVILDPVVAPALTTSNIKDRTVASNVTLAYDWGMLQVGRAFAESTQTAGYSRSFLMYQNLPSLTSSDVVVNAVVQLYRDYGTSAALTVEVHKVNSTWSSNSITWATQPEYNENIEDYAIVQEDGHYTWVITDIVRDWYANANTGMMFKASDSVENGSTDSYKQFYSSDFTENNAYQPVLLIQFRNNNGLESYWDYTSSSAGRAGTGYVNNFTGNLIWTRADMGFDGNRMPVSISHVYNLNDSTVPSDQNNSNDSGANGFGMGNGWRTNYNQLVYRWQITDGTLTDAEYYIWEDSDGTDHYFKYSSANTYKDEDGMELTLTTNGTGTEKYKITDKNGNISFFDTQGRLTKIQNNQATKSSITVTYADSTSKRISTVTDGVGRVYTFNYTGELLTRISYKSTGTEEIYYTRYVYDASNNLVKIIDKDNEESNYTYSGNRLTSATDIDGYQVTYTYNSIGSNTWKPYRVERVTAADNGKSGGSLIFDYTHNQTKLTDHNQNVSILQFNDFGNLICVQDDEGRAQFTQYALNTDKEKEDNTDATKKSNQLRLASVGQYTISNLLADCNMRFSIDQWTAVGATVDHYISTARRYIDLSSIYVVTDAADSGLQTTYTLAPGQTHSFSCYVVADSTGVRLKAQCGDTVVASEEQQINSEWRRLQVSYTNNTAETQTVTYGVYTTDSGNFYMDCAQLELAATASAYNLMNNGDFRYAINSNTWVKSNCTTNDKIVTLGNSAVPQLDNHVFQIIGDPLRAKSVKQVVYLPGTAGDSLTLSGWAKGNSAPLYTDDNREFAIRATIHYASGTDSEPFIARFNPDSDQWQYTATEIVAEEDFWRITVELLYSKNVNTVYFDGIQLLKDRFGDKYSYDARGNLTSVWDSCDQTSTYTYSAGDDLTEQTLPNGEKITYEYDTYHNVTKVTEENGLVSTLGYDTYGNNTTVSISDGTTVMSSSAAYTADGNLLLSTTDALGRTTKYSYDPNTGVLKWVQYPKDTDGTGDSADTRTAYTYDDMYRMASAACTTDTGLNLSAEYAYEDDLLKSIETPTTTYNFTYGDFSLRTGVSIGDPSVGYRTLATYTYTEDGNNYLKKLDYGNGDKVEYEYDDKGRVNLQTYEDGDTVTYTYDNTGSVATFHDSATGATGKYISDFSGRVGMYTEDADDYYFSVRIGYDSRSRLSGMSEYINGHRRGINYVYDSEDRLESYKKANGKRAYTYDGFDRVESAATSHLETPVITTDYTFTAPQSGTTSGQVESVRHTLGTSQTPHVTYTYTYDNNGNILTVSDGTNTTSYVYDSANQLTRENNQAGGFTYTWTYDNAGNILTREEYAYTTGVLGDKLKSVEYKYEDTKGWGDLLTDYDGTEIDYDDIGNPTEDGTWTYNWEHGRELASMTSKDGSGLTWTYTYNADGLRTKRTNGTTTYNYVYYGGQLQYMEVNGSKMFLATAPDGTPMSIIYAGDAYYYMTNLQGDVVGLINQQGEIVVEYTYDAWGNPLTPTGSMADTLGQINPFRYRGYVYDSETGLYYLQSRYYDPEKGRFLNGDVFYTTGQGFVGNNMFAYCGNNPLMAVIPAERASTIGSYTTARNVRSFGKM